MSEKRRTDEYIFVQAEAPTFGKSTQIGGAFAEVTRASLSVGLLSQVVPTEGVFSPYSRLPLDIVFPDNSVSSKSTNLGLRVALGCDFVFVYKEDAGFFAFKDRDKRRVYNCGSSGGVIPVKFAITN